MSPLSEKQMSAHLERWLQEAREGSGESLRKTLAVCREYLAAIAAEELPAGPGRGAVAQYLANSAFVEVQKLLPTFQGSSEGELREWLRQILLEQTSAMPGKERRAGSGNFSTPDPGSVITKAPGRSTPAGAPADSAPLLATPPVARASRSEDVADFALKTTEEIERTMPAPGKDGPPKLLQVEGFEIANEIARGGMGVVYRAWQERLQRWVALKCLPPAFAEDPERLRRFRQEARLAAQFTEHGILQVYDVLERGNTPILVLPYIEGSDLSRIIAQRRALREGQAVADAHPWANMTDADYLAQILPFFDKILDALVRLHGAGVLHRDLKPSNILVDKNGNGWLTDFGLARLNQLETTTHAGRGLGTRGFMSPEQWDGDENIDGRTDVFGMGVTLYQALTLELPYGKQCITADTPPAQLTKARQRHLPAHIDLVLLKATQPDRRRRYESAAALREDWLRVRKGLLPRKAAVGRSRRLLHVARQRSSQIVAGVALLLILILGAVSVMQAMKEPVVAPIPRVVRRVDVATEPPGARVALVPLSADDGTPQFDKAVRPSERTPVTVSDVPPGNYLVVVEIEKHGFHEVYRRVPAPGEQSPTDLARMFRHMEFTERDDNTVVLPPITVPKGDVTEDMALFPGGEFIMGKDFGEHVPEVGPMFAPPHQRSVDAFFLDKTEVTVGTFRRLTRGLPEPLRKLAPAEDEAVRFVTFDEAVHFAELLGKRLPDEVEYEFAATNGGKNRFPWGDEFALITSWSFGPVGAPDYDRAVAIPSVCGLFSNVAEWTCSWHQVYPAPGLPPDLPDTSIGFVRIYTVRGGPPCVIDGDAQPRERDRQQHWDAHERSGVPRNAALAGLGSLRT